eukprot:TRINITY_DN2156_c0_g1_i1.p1 TRINITY_DN2156_c0_g1~~TRINITY_DN2156_c0_g1_i1.p1  ORF type:complete len:327 (-),score=47.65 TRINITY_DN2156_c0_g1_i1:25-1005(-)
MEYTRFGNTGVKVSRLCFGTMGVGDPKWKMGNWVQSEDDSLKLLRKAFDIGVNFFDTADSYSDGKSEEILGKAVNSFAQGRESVVLATKVFYPTGKGVNDSGLSRKHIMHSVEQSLKRLQTDHIDLYQVHRWDYNTDIRETLETLDDLVRSGKVRYIGASSMYAWQFMKALSVSEFHHLAKHVSMQTQYSLLYREDEREMLPCCRDQQIAVIPFCPLGRGLLARPPESSPTLRSTTDPITKNYYHETHDPIIIHRVQEIAQKKNVTMAQVSLKWVLDGPGITSAIIGATKPEQLDDLLNVFKVNITKEERAYLEEPYKPRPLLNVL